jgi:8-oxo-dGTP diphosphatase
MEIELAAGGVVVRDRDGRLQVLLVHRRRYDDWSFPKGHLEPGEHPLVTAVREVAEESALRVRLGAPLPGLAYPLADGRSKLVRFWLAEPLGPTGAPIDADEVDRTRWCDVADAAGRLSYPDEQPLLEHVRRLRPAGAPGRALVVLRHARALARDDWTGPDEQRPLDDAGRRQAATLVDLLDAFGPTHLHSSDALRCTATLADLARSRGLPIEVDSRLWERAGGDEVQAAVRALRADVVASGGVRVLCTHRQTLPDVFAALDLAPVQLAKGAFAVAHLSVQGELLALEVHEP